MKRDKESTKQRLIDAVGKILVEQGFQGIGINAIAKEAGVDKVLIYRYFGNLDGLLHAFAAQKDYFSNLQNLVGEQRDITSKAEVLELSKRIFIGQLRQILQNKELQEFLLWELLEKNQATDAIAEVRERQGVAVLEAMRKVVDFDKVDLPAFASIMIGGIYYLVLRSRSVDVYSGINLRTKEGWQRIEQAIVDLVDVLVERI